MAEKIRNKKKAKSIFDDFIIIEELYHEKSVHIFKA